jgi:hypothetical protein
MFLTIIVQGNTLDYLMSFSGDTSAGQCLDFVSNPYTAVLIPEPVDYFKVNFH